MDDPADIRGELLCSFQLIAFEELSKVCMRPNACDPHMHATECMRPTCMRLTQVPLNDITPAMRDVEIELNVVGLRSMLTYNNSPIQMPCVLTARIHAPL